MKLLPLSLHVWLVTYKPCYHMIICKKNIHLYPLLILTVTVIFFTISNCIVTDIC